MLEVKPARVDRSDYFSQTVWDFTYCANEKIFFSRTFCTVIFSLLYLFCSGQISVWYSLYSAVENICTGLAPCR